MVFTVSGLKESITIGLISSHIQQSIHASCVTAAWMAAHTCTAPWEGARLTLRSL